MRLAPCIPHWLTLEREAEMQIDDLIRNCAVFIGDTKGDQFYADGTGFLCSLTIDDFDFRYVVTARHVIWPGRMEWGRKPPPHEQALIRVNTKRRTARNITTSRGDWIFPEDRFLDICAFRLSETEHNPDGDMASTAINISTMSLINTTDNFEEYGIYRVFDRTLSLGDEIFLTGVFVNRVGSKRNIPVIRIGNIAAMPEESYEIFSPRHRVYLIETRSLGGLSGSPVFLHLYPDRPRGDPITMGYAHATPSGGSLQDGDTVVMPYVLIGMVLGASFGQYASDFENPPARDAEFNSGFSVVLPVKQIIEFLHTPQLLQERAEAIAARRKLSGYRDSRG
jgi:hypothetical protein